jgi:hypothetical protein
MELFVAQHGKPGVLVFSPTGELQRSFGQEILDTPHGLRTHTRKSRKSAADDKNIMRTVWVADFGKTKGKCLREFDTNGKLLTTVGIPGKPGNRLPGRKTHSTSYTQ